MSYKDKGKRKEADRERQRRHRALQKGVTSLGVTGEGVTQYPAIIHALCNPDKRVKLEKIYSSLKDCKVENAVYYGYPAKYWYPEGTGISFDTIGELLEVTQ